MSLWNKVWYEPHPLSLALRPISHALQGIVWARHKAYSKGWLTQYNAPIPVIVVGNISVGGTGKTPFIIWLGKLLQKTNKPCGQPIRIGVVSRGYKSESENKVSLLHADSLPEQVGDEPYMIYRHLTCPMAVGAERVKAIELLVAHHELDLILSDDGMQHYAMARQLEIALVDGTRGLGNAQLLPAGPLREAPQRLRSVNFVVANSLPFKRYPVMQLKAEQFFDVTSNTPQGQLASLSGQTVHAIAGIGNPQRFFTTLTEQGIKCIEHPKADHHHFELADVQFEDTLPVLMTEKDAVKCRKLGANKLWYVPVEAQLPDDFSTALLNEIQDLLASEKIDG